MNTTLNELLFDPGADARVVIQQSLRVGRILELASLGFAVDMSYGQLAATLAGYLNGSVGDVLVGAWDSHARIREACRDTAFAPEKEKSIPLAPHGRRVDKRLHVVADTPLGSRPIIDVRIRIDIKFDSALVVVRGGRVAGVSAGEASAVGLLGFSRQGETQLHKIAERTTPVVRLSEYLVQRPVAPPART